LKPERLSDEQPNIAENGGINLLSVYRSMLGAFQVRGKELE